MLNTICKVYEYYFNFNRVVTAVKELAGHDKKKNTFEKPSLALKNWSQS